MECDGARARHQPKREEELVFETRVAPVEARKEQFAEAFEIAGREKRGCIHVGMMPATRRECKDFP